MNREARISTIHNLPSLCCGSSFSFCGITERMMAFLLWKWAQCKLLCRLSSWPPRLDKKIGQQPPCEKEKLVAEFGVQLQVECTGCPMGGLQTAVELGLTAIIWIARENLNHVVSIPVWKQSCYVTICGGFSLSGLWNSGLTLNVSSISVDTDSNRFFFIFSSLSQLSPYYPKQVACNCQFDLIQ